jgi:hypothetical protein
MIEVPSNVSRLFKTSQEAMSQPTARIDLTKDPIQGGHIFNRLYDPSLTFHDFNYCTSNHLHLSESLNVFKVLKEFVQSLNELYIVDIGCGQGEFVDELRTWGLEVVGYDPVLRRETEYLYPVYFDENELSKYSNLTVLYMMRCVLPHIENPWGFLDQLLNQQSTSAEKFAYIEYQQTEWIVEKGVWQNISHDHVNLFTHLNFKKRYKIIQTGEFANGEWRWLLVSKLCEVEETQGEVDLTITQIQKLFAKRTKDLERISKLDRPLAIYGAAGKGAMLAHAISSVTDDLIAVDQDDNRTYLYLECSGVQVQPLNFLTEAAQRDRLIIVANPNHFLWLRDKLPKADFFEL